MTMQLTNMLKTPWVWAALAGLLLFVYGVLGRLAYINIIVVIKHFKSVFTKKKDFVFFLLFPFLLAIASTLHSSIDDELSNLMAVVLSILTSMVLTFMAMTNDRYESSLGKDDKDINDLQLKARNEDALSVGIYEILTSILVLILIFLLPIFEKKPLVLTIISFFVYFGFYSFLLNIFIMVRRLFQIYVSSTTRK